jgi:hypothetical protein
MCQRLKQATSENFDDVDFPVYYSKRFDEYSLKIFDGGESKIIIGFCPWCGERLAESKRELWFDELEKLGINPWSQEIPEKYLTEEWWSS